MPMTMALGPGQTEWRVLWTGDVLVSQDNVHRLGQFIVYSTCSYTPYVSPVFLLRFLLQRKLTSVFALQTEHEPVAQLSTYC